MIFIEIIGVIIGNIRGNSKIGNTNDLFLTYIENAETKLPQIDKSKEGINTPKLIKRDNWVRLKLGIDGIDMKTLNRKRIISTKHNNIKQNTVLLNIIKFPETGAESKPPIVPESFSLTKSFVIMYTSVKNIISQFSITKISNGID